MSYDQVVRFSVKTNFFVSESFISYTVRIFLSNAATLQLVIMVFCYSMVSLGSVV